MYFQIELLSPKQNGSVEGGGCDRESKKAQTASIKGMWKKAFRSLKKKDSVDEPDKQEVKQQDPKYSRLVSTLISRTRSKILQTSKCDYPIGQTGSQTKSEIVSRPERLIILS